jgi:hypothetical protein
MAVNVAMAHPGQRGTCRLTHIIRAHSPSPEIHGNSVQDSCPIGDEKSRANSMSIRDRHAMPLSARKFKGKLL